MNQNCMLHARFNSKTTATTPPKPASTPSPNSPPKNSLLSAPFPDLPPPTPQSTTKSIYKEAKLTLSIEASWTASNGTLYASSKGILYVSSDQGVTWRALITFNSSSGTEINCVYVNKSNYIFVSPNASAKTAEIGLWRSTDGGQNWTKVLALPQNCSIWPMTENAKGALFVGVYTINSVANARIYRSTDYGSTWTSVYYDSAARHIHCVTVDKATNYIYASVGDLIGPWNTTYVIRSTDGGNTWTKILAGLPQIIAIEASVGARLFASDASTTGQIFRSTDDLTACLVLDTGAQSYGYWIRTNDLNGDIYASFIGGEHPTNWLAGIWISTSKGLTWSLYKNLSIHRPYLGSLAASNFNQGIFYYSIKLDKGWQKGTKIYPDYSASSK